MKERKKPEEKRVDFSAQNVRVNIAYAFNAVRLKAHLKLCVCVCLIFTIPGISSLFFLNINFIVMPVFFLQILFTRLWNVYRKYFQTGFEFKTQMKQSNKGERKKNGTENMWKEFYWIFPVAFMLVIRDEINAWTISE